jgi:adenylate cyclase
LTDVFAVQDDITVNVVKALQVTLLEGEQARIWHRSTSNVEAWSCLTRAKACHTDHMALEENRAGIELLERAVELDPDYASAWSWLGWLLIHEVRFFWTDQPTDLMARVAECAHKALALDENLAEAHMLLGLVHLLDGDYAQAVAAAERGVALGPNNADVAALLAYNLNWVGRPEEALVRIEKAMRFSPAFSSWFVGVKAHALRLLGRFDEAVEMYRAAVSETPVYLSPRVGLTACYAEMGRKADARESARKLLELEPEFSIERYIRKRPEYKDRALTERTAEALREAGLPRTAVGATLGLSSEDMGEREVKSIAEPVWAHRVLSKSAKTDMHSAPGGTTAPALPEKAFIAVLPFENTSGYPEQQYFADGITENIITGLTHIVEGSVRKAVNRVRVTVQLIDATSGQRVWAEHYDRDLDDIFVVQDEITNIIVATLAGRIEEAGRHRAEHKVAKDMAAYDYWLRGRQCLNRYTKEGELEARRHFERSLELDPGYAAAYAGLAVSYIHEYYASWSEAPHEVLDRAYELAQKAVALDDADSTACYGLAQAYFARHQPELAKIQIEKALALNPNDYHNLCSKGWYLALSGERVEGIVCSNEAMRLNPFAPDNCLLSIGVAEYLERRYETALAAFGKIRSLGLLKPACLAACYAKLGRDQQARAAAAEVLESAKTVLTIQLGEDAERWRSYWTKQFPFQNPDDFEHLLGGLRKAGLPG